MAGISDTDEFDQTTEDQQTKELLEQSIEDVKKMISDTESNISDTETAIKDKKIQIKQAEIDLKSAEALESTRLVKLASAQAYYDKLKDSFWTNGGHLMELAKQRLDIAYDRYAFAVKATIAKRDILNGYQSELSTLQTALAAYKALLEQLNSSLNRLLNQL